MRKTIFIVLLLIIVCVSETITQNLSTEPHPNESSIRLLQILELGTGGNRIIVGGCANHVIGCCNPLEDPQCCDPEDPPC